jgi:hypothetical protein
LFKKNLLIENRMVAPNSDVTCYCHGAHTPDDQQPGVDILQCAKNFFGSEYVGRALNAKLLQK